MDQNLIPNYRIEGDDSTVIFDTSYVANPATQKGFLKFKKVKFKQMKNTKQMRVTKFKQIKNTKFKQMRTTKFKQMKNAKFSMLGEWERMTSGVWFMPDTQYLRVDDQGNYYTVEISKEALKSALINFLKRGFANSTSLEHSQPMSDDKFIAVEYWIIDSPETLSPIYKLSLTDLGYDPNEIPIGTVMKTTYVADEQFWNDYVLTGKVTGYSIEGLFSLTLDNIQSFNEVVEDTIPEEVKQKAQEIVDGEITVDDTTYIVSEGNVVDIVKSTEEEVQDFNEDSTDSIEDESVEVRDLARELDELKELVLQLQDEKEAQKSELESKEKQLEAMRKELNNQPIKSNFTASSVKQNLKEFKIGGKTFYI
jgi:hypothetical protein